MPARLERDNRAFSRRRICPSNRLLWTDQKPVISAYPVWQRLSGFRPPSRILDRLVTAVVGRKADLAGESTRNVIRPVSRCGATTSCS